MTYLTITLCALTTLLLLLVLSIVICENVFKKEWKVTSSYETIVISLCAMALIAVAFTAESIVNYF